MECPGKQCWSCLLTFIYHFLYVVSHYYTYSEDFYGLIPCSAFSVMVPGSPLKGVLALRSEVVHVRFEVEFEDVVFVDVLRLGRNSDGVAKQREARQRIVILWTGDRPQWPRFYQKHTCMCKHRCSPSCTTHLVWLVEEEAEVGEHHPEFLPTVAVFELSQQVSRELVLEPQKTY